MCCAGPVKGCKQPLTLALVGPVANGINSLDVDKCVLQGSPTTWLGPTLMRTRVQV